MPKDYLFPDISIQALKLIEIMRRSYKENPDYWEHSPYPNEVEKYFRSWFDKPIVEQDPNAPDPRAEELLGENRWDALYREVVDLYVQLKASKPSAGDASESMAYFRTMTGLMDKLVSHQERALGIKQVHQFHTAVMDIMENVLTEEQRSKAMEQLKNAINAD